MGTCHSYRPLVTGILAGMGGEGGGGEGGGGKGGGGLGLGGGGGGDGGGGLGGGEAEIVPNTMICARPTTRLESVARMPPLYDVPPVSALPKSWKVT